MKVVLRNVKRYGTEPDRPDRRDRIYEIPGSLRRHLPHRVDLRPQCPPVYNQRHLNSCSANAIAAALWFDERRHARTVPSPSRLFIYYNERAREDSVSINATVSLRDGYRSVAQTGVCSERMWPYIVERYRRKPSARCYYHAASRRALRYERLEKTLPHLQACLAEGFPFTGGFSVYQRFESRDVRRTGVVAMPGPHEKKLGGHAMLVVGYSDARKQFIVRNSWGSAWGDKGYCYLPYEYVLAPKHAWDFWTVRRVSSGR